MGKDDDRFFVDCYTKAGKGRRFLGPREREVRDSNGKNEKAIIKIFDFIKGLCICAGAFAGVMAPVYRYCIDIQHQMNGSIGYHLHAIQPCYHSPGAGCFDLLVI